MSKRIHKLQQLQQYVKMHILRYFDNRHIKMLYDSVKNKRISTSWLESHIYGGGSPPP